MAMPNSKNNVTVRKLASALQGLWDKVKNAFQPKLPTSGTASSTYAINISGEATSATYANYPAGFSSHDSSLPNWGTLTSGNGYTSITRWVSVDSEIVFAKKSGALSVQIDGWFYQNEGKYRVLDTSSQGAANGVASLDANGKVPSSQLPIVPTGNLPANSSSSAGIVASGSGQANKVWMTDSSGNPSWRRGSTQFLYDYTFGIRGSGPGYIHIGTLTPRGTGGDTDQLLFSGIGGIGDFQKLVLVQVMFRGSSPGIKSTVLDGGTTNQTLFGWYKDSNNVYHMMMKLANWSSTSECLRVLYKGNAITFDFYNLDSEPANVTYVDNYYVTRSPMGQSVGNASTPVYVNSSGEIVACTNVPAIEHVTTIPPNPTVGTIYAL